MSLQDRAFADRDLTFDQQTSLLHNLFFTSSHHRHAHKQSNQCSKQKRSEENVFLISEYVCALHLQQGKYPVVGLFHVFKLPNQMPITPLLSLKYAGTIKQKKKDSSSKKTPFFFGQQFSISFFPENAPWKRGTPACMQRAPEKKQTNECRKKSKERDRKKRVVDGPALQISLLEKVGMQSKRLAQEEIWAECSRLQSQEASPWLSKS